MATDEFLSVISHELRTRLNAIPGWSQILQPDASHDDLTQGLQFIQAGLTARVGHFICG